MVELAFFVLHHFDGKILAVPKAWIIMKSLQEYVYSFREAPFFLDPLIATRFEKQFEACWKLILTDVYYVEVLLNSYLTNLEDLHNNKAK